MTRKCAIPYILTALTKTSDRKLESFSGTDETKKYREVLSSNTK